jgi:hypothetical protein
VERTEVDVFPSSFEQVVIEDIEYVGEKVFIFSCSFNGRPFVFDFLTIGEEKLAKKVAKIISDHRGQLVSAIAMVEVPEGD